MIRGVGIASVKNYVELISEWFNISLDEFGFCLVPVSALESPATINALSGNKAEKNFVDYLESIIANQEQDSPKSVSIILNVKVYKSSQIQNGVSFQIDPNSDRKIALSEETLLNQYPLSYKELVNKLKKRYSDFFQNKKFYDIMKTVKMDKSCCWVRFGNPKKKTQKVEFYNTNTFNHFDKVYKRE